MTTSQAFRISPRKLVQLSFVRAYLKMKLNQMKNQNQNLELEERTKRKKAKVKTQMQKQKRRKKRMNGGITGEIGFQMNLKMTLVDLKLSKTIWIIRSMMIWLKDS